MPGKGRRSEVQIQGESLVHPLQSTGLQSDGKWGCGPEETTGGGPAPDLTPPLTIIRLTEKRKRHFPKGMERFKLSLVLQPDLCHEVGFSGGDETGIAGRKQQVQPSGSSAATSMYRRIETQLLQICGARGPKKSYCQGTGRYCYSLSLRHLDENF